MEEDKTKSKNKIYIGIVVALIIVLAICGTVYYYKDYFSASSESKSSISSSTKTATNKEDSDNETATLTRSVDEKNIEITESGTHELSGEYESVTIKANGNVELKLNDVEITSDDGPAIYVEDAKNVEIVLSGKNKITATTTEDFDGAIYSKADLVISGDGELEVVSNYDGIVSKDTLTIKDGTYIINSEDDGIRGKDSVEIVAGTYTITAAGDGIKSTNDEDTDLGYIKISAGKFNITAGDDAINAITTLTIEDGDFTITAKDDAIHADGMIEIKGGNYNITAAEGIEATYVKIDDGTININASDDGINAGNKSDQYSVKIEINGGNITIKMGSGDTGFALNIFVDLLLCSLIYFFINYTPKKFFQGKKIIIFRLFTIFPLLYEIGGILIKYFIYQGTILPTTFFFFLLPGKPPMILVAFLLLCLLIKIGEVIKIKKGYDEAELSEHYKTNAHAFRVSILISYIFGAVALVDFLMFLLFSVIYGGGTFGNNINPDTISYSVNIIYGLGFGKSSILLAAIPFVLLFSYKKVHKNKEMDKFIPIVGVGLIAIVYIEGVFRVVTVNIPIIIEKIVGFLDTIMGGGSEPEPQPLLNVSETIKEIIH